jgi:protoheme IX farnesyltransferase
MNMVIDRDIDRLMPRTQGRPLVTGLVAPREAVIFAIVLEIAAFVLLTWQVNLLVGRARARRDGVLRRRSTRSG